MVSSWGYPGTKSRIEKCGRRVAIPSSPSNACRVDRRLFQRNTNSSRYRSKVLRAHAMQRAHEPALQIGEGAVNPRQQHMRCHDADDLGIVLVLGQFPVAGQPVADDLGAARHIPLDTKSRTDRPVLSFSGSSRSRRGRLSSSTSTAPMISSLPTFGMPYPLQLGHAWTAAEPRFHLPPQATGAGCGLG